MNPSRLPHRTPEQIRALLREHGTARRAWFEGLGNRGNPTGAWYRQCREAVSGDSGGSTSEEVQAPLPEPDRFYVDDAAPAGDCVTLPLVGRVVVLPDIHAPYHDPRALDCALQAIHVLRPQGILQIGDAADCYQLSRFPKDPGRQQRAVDELEQAGEVMRYIDAALPSCVQWKVMLSGNHEDRLDSYVRNRAPDLDGMVRSVRSFILPDGWQWVSSKQYARVGKMAYHHGWRHGIYAVRQSLQDWGGCLTFGHTHRAATWYGGTVRGEDHVCVNVGWLGDFDAIDYRLRATARRDWQHAISPQDFDADGTVHAHVSPIVGGVMRIGSRRVTA